MRIAIVNDLSLARESLKQILEKLPGHTIAWEAVDGNEAVEKCIQDRPDIILMDLIMPNLDGAEATRKIMEMTPCAILVVTASVTGNCDKVYDAMGYGALDAVTTPGISPNGLSAEAKNLIGKIEQISVLLSKPKAKVLNLPQSNPPRLSSSPSIIALGASTGGPQTLAKILADLPKDYPAPIVIIQHVDSAFAPGFAFWLGKETALNVKVAENNEKALPGTVYIASSQDHLVFGIDQHFHYTPDPIDVIFRPSIDVFFKSLAMNMKQPGIAIQLTGLGQDGAEGLFVLKQKGWHTIAQDEATSKVFNMPQAAIEQGAATQILPDTLIAETLRKKATLNKI